MEIVMNKLIAVLLLVSLIGWCVIHAMQESSGGVRGGKWSGVTLLPDTRFQKKDDDTGQSTADRRRARDAAKEEARAAKEKDAANNQPDVSAEASTDEQPLETPSVE